MKTVAGWMIVVLSLTAALLAVSMGWFADAGAWLDVSIRDFSDWYKQQFGQDTIFSYNWMVSALLGVLLSSLICGTTSSLVVSNRMAFFSDAIAHCAFAGIGLGIILSLAQFVGKDHIVAVMMAFGVAAGVGIGFVKEKTLLASDTVIGVFFAAAMALGAIFLTAIRGRGVFTDPEQLLFGDLLGIMGQDLVFLTVLLLLAAGFLLAYYNRFVFVSFNPSLARSRNFPVRLSNYLFIILLALIVNTCFRVVGILLINALLVLPAAAASNLSRNLRQFFWLSTAISLASGLSGLFVSHWFVLKVGGLDIPLSSGGTIVLIGAAIFFVSMPLGRFVRGSRPSLRSSV